MFRNFLYRKPFITAFAFLAGGIFLVFLGFARAGDANMNNYAFAAFGVMSLIVSAVTFTVYGMLEKRYKHLLQDTPLLRYRLPKESRTVQTEKNVAELKMHNKALLLIMLFFCVLFSIILPFMVEEKLLMVGICLGLGVFLSIAAWLITAYRVRKLRKGGEEVILGSGGAFLNGAFHAWDMPDTGVTDFAYEPPALANQPGELRIEYTADVRPAPMTETVILEVPPEAQDQIPAVLKRLKELRLE